MELMESFPWPHNLDQLQHILKELILITRTPYITISEVRQMLDQEASSTPELPPSELDLSKTLEEINY
ncbi:MAG: hypothetical protein ACLR9K_13480 [Blautia sp.]